MRPKVRRLAAHVIREAFRDRLFVLLLSLFLFLSMLSIYVGSATSKAEMRAYNQTVELIRQKNETVIPEPPDIPALGILKNSIDYITIIGALFALFIGFDSVSKEREQGTLPLLLSRPIYRDQIITGKTLGVFSILLFLHLCVFLMELILLSIIGNYVITLPQFLRLAAFHGISIMYMLAFYLLAVLLSILTSDSSSSFLGSITLWVGLTYILPQLSKSVASYSIVENTAATSVAAVSQDSGASLVIDFLSPASHLKRLGLQLLENTHNSSRAVVDGVFLVLLAVILFACAHIVFLRKEQKLYA